MLVVNLYQGNINQYCSRNKQEKQNLSLAGSKSKIIVF